MTNARIKDVPGTDLKSEAVAVDIHLRYDPMTQGTLIDFYYKNFCTHGDGTVVPGFTDGAYDQITVNISKLGADKVGLGLVDPVTGARLDFISGYGVALIFKAITDRVYNDRAELASVTPPPAMDFV